MLETTTTAKVWMRWTHAGDAVACAARLAAKHGTGRFAVVHDDMGMRGFAYPYAVISHPAVS